MLFEANRPKLGSEKLDYQFDELIRLFLVGTSCQPRHYV